MEKLLRVSHATNRGAGIGGLVICAETTPQDIGKHMELMEKQEFDVELIYWKQASGSQNKGIILFYHSKLMYYAHDIV